MIKNKSRKAQITIFIIVGILLIGAIALFFLLRTDMIPDITGGSDEINPNSYMTSCIEDKLIEATELISAQGGHISNPLSLRFKFTDEGVYWNISYLCYNVNYYRKCINQEPMLIQHLKDEIYSYIEEDVENCFNDLNSSLVEQGYDVEAVYRDFEVVLAPKKVTLEIDASIISTKTEETKNIDGIKTTTSTRFYDMALIVQEIVNQEAEYCNFNHLGYMLLYPENKISKYETVNSDTIYTIKNKKTEEKFRFAIRSCVLPPGL